MEQTRLFEELNFNRYIERFNLRESSNNDVENKEELYTNVSKTEKEIIEYINKTKEMIFNISTIENKKEEKIIKEKIDGISIYNKEKITKYKY